MASITTRFVRRARARGVTVYTRRQWAGRSLKLAVYQWRRRFRRHDQIPRQRTDTLVQHITVTRDDGPTAANFAADMRELHAIGMSRFASGVSYNLAWDMVTGEVGIGQAFDAAGTHTLNDKKVPGYSDNLNYRAVAIAAIGMPGAKPTDKALTQLERTIAAMIEVGVLTHGFDYDPHSKFAFKDCPTEAMRDRMSGIRHDALELVAKGRK